VRVNQRDTDYWLSEANVFDGDTDLVPGIRAQAACGHTAGHSMYLVESKNEKLLLWGDIVHVAAVQFEHPSVIIGYETSQRRNVNTSCNSPRQHRTGT
jgi:glyoxylase-like metal-dependent hydrolase (beta-lactamase superfamily II)